MDRYFIIDKKGKNQILIGDPTVFDVWCPIVGEVDEVNFECYDIVSGANGSYELSISKFKEKRKNEAREKRKELFEELDGLYFNESEKMYQKETFKKTPEMDEIMRKKKVLRDLPQQIDAFTTVEEVRNFVIPNNIANL